VTKSSDVNTGALRDRFRGCLLGLATGDALGTTLEFKQRGTFEPLEEMVGGGPFRLSAGQWTDDTSMALCLSASLVELGAFDARDQMERYSRWARDGYMSSTGRCFDIGNTVAAALARFQETGEPYSGSCSTMSAGNGSIMRLAPVAMFYHPDLAMIEHFAAASSRTTHGTAECVDACRLFGLILGRALAGCSKEDVLLGSADTFSGEGSIVELARGTYRKKPGTSLRGRGYVVASLESALWCFDRSNTYSDAVLAAANLGEDADTTAAVCGQLAGAYYGVAGIPTRWLDRIAMRAEITTMADQLYRQRTGSVERC
jgi:ADP-ribosylglycohydrolase